MDGSITVKAKGVYQVNTTQIESGVHPDIESSPY
jgi:hypothetical protein